MNLVAKIDKIIIKTQEKTLSFLPVVEICNKNKLEHEKMQFRVHKILLSFP